MKFSTASFLLLAASSEAFMFMAPAAATSFRRPLLTRVQLDIVDAVIVVGDEPTNSRDQDDAADSFDDELLAFEKELKLTETIAALEKSIEQNEARHSKVVEKLQDEFKTQESNFRKRIMDLEQQLQHAVQQEATTAGGATAGAGNKQASSDENEAATLRAELALLLQERVELERQLEGWKERSKTGKDDAKVIDPSNKANPKGRLEGDQAALAEAMERLEQQCALLSEQRVELEQKLVALNERYSAELAEVQNQLKAEQDLRLEGELALTQSMKTLEQQYALLSEQRDELQQELEALKDAYATELVNLENQLKSEHALRLEGALATTQAVQSLEQQHRTEAELRAELAVQSNELAKLEQQLKGLKQRHTAEVKEVSAQLKAEQALRVKGERSMARELDRLEQKYKTDLQKATMGNQNKVVGQSQYHKKVEQIQYDMTSQLIDQKMVLQDVQSKLQTTELELQEITSYTEALVEERNSLRQLAKQSWNVVKERLRTRWSTIRGAQIWKKSKPRTKTEDDSSTTVQVPLYWLE